MMSNIRLQTNSIKVLQVIAVLVFSKSHSITSEQMSVLSEYFSSFHSYFLL